MISNTKTTWNQFGLSDTIGWNLIILQKVERLLWLDQFGLFHMVKPC